MEIGLERKGRQEESVVALIYAVEDDKNILEIEMFALKNSGYQVDGFECARDFYKKLDEKQPDLILLDVSQRLFLKNFFKIHCYSTLLKNYSVSFMHIIV